MIIKTLYSKNTKAAVLLSGKFTIDAEMDFDSEIEHLLKKEPSAIIIRMKDVDFIDSSGIGILMKNRNRSENAGISYILFDISQNVKRTLTDGGVIGFFKISDNDEDGKIFINERKFK